MDKTYYKVFLCRKRLLLIALLNFSDWLCTITLLRHEGFFEVNPLMVQLVDSPLLCFLIKCILPFCLILYIYKMLPKSGERLIAVVSSSMLVITGFYLAINILHIFNFIILFILQ